MKPNCGIRSCGESWQCWPLGTHPTPLSPSLAFYTSSWAEPALTAHTTTQDPSPSATPQECPTGGEYCTRYLAKLQAWLRAQPLATVLLNTKVESVARDGLLKKDDLGGSVRRQRRFVVKWTDADGQEGFLYAECVLDTSGAPPRESFRLKHDI